MDYKQLIEDSDYSQNSLAKEIGISRDTLMRFIKDPKNKNRKYVKILVDKVLNGELLVKDVSEKKNILESNVNSKGIMETTIKGLKESAHGKSLEEMVKLFKVDPNKWECTSYRANQWDVTAKINGVLATSTNFGAMAKFAPLHKINLVPEDLGWLYNMAKDVAYETQLPKVEYGKSDNVLVLPIFDAHIGKLAWGKETGENYDIKIGVSRYRATVVDLVRRADVVGFSKIIFPLGNDFFQIDDDQSATTKGTRVDSDIRWKKLFKIGVNLLKETINYCAKYAPVDVVLVQGNHDNKMSFYAFETLRGWYDEHPYVSIDEDIRTRTYRQVGVNLLGFTHGDKEKDRLFEIMQNEARKMWGRTLYAEWIIGHFHHSMVKEKQGVRVRVVSSITGKDAWHYESGYGSLTAAQAIIYNKKMAGPLVVFHISFTETI